MPWWKQSTRSEKPSKPMLSRGAMHRAPTNQTETKMYEMYRENILDHGQNPRHRGILNPADIDFEGHNPLCGDRLRLTLRLDENKRITEIGWDGDGCAISQASASMLGEEILGKTLEEVRSISKE